MPTVLLSGPYRFFYYSADCAEPAHVHVERDRATLKIWLHDLSVARSRHFPAGEIEAILAIARAHHSLLKDAGMRTVPLDDELSIRTAWFEGDTLFVGLSDGRTVGTPVTWYPRLQAASERQRQNWRLIAEGDGVHWPDVDEDLSLEGVLAGRSAPKAPLPAGEG